jgi:hypothetical protein
MFSSEGSLCIHGDEPEGELGHFHCHRIDVDTIKATVGNDAARNREALRNIAGHQPFTRSTLRKTAFRCSQHLAGVFFLFVFSCFRQPLGEVTAHSNEETRLIDDGVGAMTKKPAEPIKSALRFLVRLEHVRRRLLHLGS